MPMTPAVKKIFADATSGNAWNNRTLRRISRTGVDGSIPISSTIQSGMWKYSTPDYNESIGTSITIGNSDTSTAPPYGLNVIPKIGDTRQSPTPDLRDFDKLDTSIDGKFTNNLVTPSILTNVISDKLSNSPIWDIYVRVGMHLVADPVNSVTPQFVDLGFSTVDALDKGAGLRNPATRVRKPKDVSHCSLTDHIFG